MKPVINVIRLGQVNIFKQLNIEELLLRKTDRNFAIINSGHPEKTIVVGFSGKIAELLDVEQVKAHRIKVIRRYTGGGTVIVDDNSVFASFILNSADAKTAPFPREIMQWSVEEIYGPLFKNCGLSNKFSLRENDYTFDDKKIAGNAQTITKNRWVHHTSFLWKFDPQNMKYLQVILLPYFITFILLFYVVLLSYRRRDRHIGLIEIIRNF